MTWDTSKSPGDLITSSDWNGMVTDQKGHSSRHSDGGADELDAADLAGGLGTSGQLLQTDGSAASWVDFQSSNLGSDIDNETIIENSGTREVPIDQNLIYVDSNGELTVSEVETYYGDFENNDSGAWSPYGNYTSMEVADTNGGAEGGSYYYLMYLSSSGNTGGIERTVDLTGISTLQFMYNVAPSGNNNVGGSSDVFRCIIDGTTEFSTAPDSNTNWLKVNVDVSDLTGSKTFKFEFENNSGNITYIGVDRIHGNIKLNPREEQDNAGGLT